MAMSDWVNIKYDFSRTRSQQICMIEIDEWSRLDDPDACERELRTIMSRATNMPKEFTILRMSLALDRLVLVVWVESPEFDVVNPHYTFPKMDLVFNP